MTVKEIAKLAGVSIGTVDRVLYQRGRVSADTRAKVKKIIETYQFTPNPIARRLKRNRSYHFCALIPRRDQDAGYWEQAIAGLKTGAGEVSPLGVETEIIEYDRYNMEEVLAKMETSMAKSPDGMIFAPNIRIKQLVPEIREKQIPYIFFDSDYPEMEPLCTISQDPIRGGYLAGRLMSLFARSASAAERGKQLEKPVAILDAHCEDYHIIQRRNGFLQYAEEHNIPTVVKEYSEEGELTENEITALLERRRDLAGFFVTNSLAHRVAQTVKDLGVREKSEKCVVIGYDLTANNRLLLKEGFIDAIISQRPEEQGRLAVINLYRHIVLEQRIESKIEMPLDVYIKENIVGTPQDPL
ncbi:MAG: LacI family DNA-binding transcriptional regulator [Treponema sp.]|jgi:LacI family transcriptional regulator|nr:LacI family DNA-binding transcriptional regulator [Treponema sp.]